MPKHLPPTPAAPYRVLDLTNADFSLCARLLADLGMEVIKVEPPGGHSDRSKSPLVIGEDGTTLSLFWAAYNAGKRSITLNLESADGLDVFRRLVKTADVVVESFALGYLKTLGLDYAALRKVNRRMVMVSLTPFGQEGPRASYKSSDIVDMAMSGVMYTTGDADRPPLRFSVPQAALYACLQGAVGTMAALYHRAWNKVGQHVDVSTQESMLWMAMPITTAWDLNKESGSRSGAVRARVGTGNLFRMHWPCKDGFVTFGLQAGQMGGPIMYALAEWIEREGYDPGFLKAADWNTFEWAAATQAQLGAISEPLMRFFKDYTKDQLFHGAMERRIILYPVYTLAEVLRIPQLQTRDYWAPVQHPKLSHALTYPGPWARFSETPLRSPQPVAKPGEHNVDIYEGELGYTREALALLTQVGTV